jgi:hypothetical protein
MTDELNTTLLTPVGESIELPLPADPADLLSLEERVALRSDLDEIARGRREAETASANLRLC